MALTEGANIAGRLLTLSKGMFTMRVRVTGEAPTCYSCPSKLLVGDTIHSTQTGNRASTMTRWRCLSCARRLNLIDEDDT